ncbi:MAG: YigZ family protein, partial [Clostridia bacterium]
MATPPQYFVVEQPTQNITIVNKSKFITTLAPIKSWNDAQELYKQICKKYSDATHNCYACIFDTLGNSLKFGDDGEPQGTAGQPMLEVLKKKNIRMTLAVVTRYFGGIK